MKWVGPYKITKLLDSYSQPFSSDRRPPVSNGVYLISVKKWSSQPTKSCKPLYIGSNTGKSQRFRTRIGDLIADMFGFFGKETGHHSGGQSLYSYCRRHYINPKNLYIGWIKNCACVRCSENQLYDSLRPALNVNRPSRCIKHLTRS